MRSLGEHLKELLAGRSLDAGPAGALSTAIWVLRRRLEALEQEQFKKLDTDIYTRVFHQRTQLQEDIQTLETLLARAEGKKLGDSRPPLPTPGHGYGET